MQQQSENEMMASEYLQSEEAAQALLAKYLAAGIRTVMRQMYGDSMCPNGWYRVSRFN